MQCLCMLFLLPVSSFIVAPHRRFPRAAKGLAVDNVGSTESGGDDAAPLGGQPITPLQVQPRII